MDDRTPLESQGFRGFVTIRDLRASALEQVPDLPGVYVLLRDSEEPPRFRNRSIGGHFKRDPTVGVDVLDEAWVGTSTVVYIGKAGGPESRSTLRRRLRQYLRFGSGEPIGHWGGRYVWQLQDAEHLVVAWRVTDGLNPEAVEKQMLRDFKAAHGRLPFANLRL
jgi:hypothetical protein